MPLPTVDLRSDTVTKPTAAMRAVMAGAEVGDDVYGEDPTVNTLESDAARLFGHEAALFVPSGTMGNQIAIQALVKPRQELICDVNAHVVRYESGGLAVTGGVSTRTVASPRGQMDIDAVTQMLGRCSYAIPTAAVAVEQTHMRAGGAVQPLELLRELHAVTAAAEVALHCDGARIWHAHVADGVPLHAYGELFDTLSVCLSKGLGAPVGSLVISTRERIAEARKLRALLGGQMRQVGILAAAGRYVLQHHVARLAEDHVRARRLADALAPFGVVDPAAVRTNMVYLELSELGIDPAALLRAAADRGVLLIAVTPTSVRAVTHLEVDDNDIEHAAEVLLDLLSRDRRTGATSRATVPVA